MSDTFSTWMKLCLTSFLDAALQMVSDHFYISGEFVSDTFFAWKCVWQVFNWIKILSDSFLNVLLMKTTRWRYWPLGWKLPNIVRTALAISIRAFYGLVDKYFIPSMRTRKIWLDFRSWDAWAVEEKIQYHCFQPHWGIYKWAAWSFSIRGMSKH